MKIISGGLLMAVLMLTSCASPPDQTQTQAAALANNAFDVRQARHDLIGKTPQDVVQLLGSPDHQAGKDQWEWWTYQGKFHDSVTHKVLDAVTFVFQNGKVLDLNY